MKAIWSLHLLGFILSVHQVTSQVPSECSHVTDNPVYLRWISGKKGDTETEEDCQASCDNEDECRMAFFLSKQKKCKKYALMNEDEINMVRCVNGANEVDDAVCEIIPNDETIWTNRAAKRSQWPTETDEQVSVDRCHQVCVEQRRCKAYRLRIRTSITKCYLVYIKDKNVYQCPKDVIIGPN